MVLIQIKDANQLHYKYDLSSLAINLKMLILDVDGVMTDGGIILIGDAMEAKRFDVQDGMGIILAKAAGLLIAIITSRTSAVVERRAKELNISDLIQGASEKVDVLYELTRKYNIGLSEVSYIGDDIQDLQILKLVGLPIAVSNAVSEVKQACLFITESTGGHGAIREVVDMLLELRGEKDQIYSRYTGND